MNEFDSIKLENDNEYVITDQLTVENIDYFSLINVDDEEDIKIRKIIDEGKLKVLAEIKDKEEERKILDAFKN